MLRDDWEMNRTSARVMEGVWEKAGLRYMSLHMIQSIDRNDHSRLCQLARQSANSNFDSASLPSLMIAGINGQRGCHQH